ncbi:uncharacterized protein LOC124537065 [Vanessa cardui]|uniref:uncharacterized protein LOC124537065 n=1 Tax=Vanessa cardui TaxID=171605 RepID=UPI001F141B1B|nr:uncharacterized protein LOC124537065 [Vanessa cardui]
MMKLSLGKFGLQHCDLPTMFSNVAALLRLITINISHRYSKRIPLIFYVTTFIVISTYFYAYIFSMVWLVIFRYGKANIEAASVALAFGTCNVTTVTKFVYMKLYAKEIENFVDKYLQCDSHVTPNTRFADNLRKKLKVVKRRATVIWVLLVSDGVIYLMIPFLLPGRQLTVDVYIFYGLEPMLETPNYEIANVVMILGIGFAVYTMVSVAVYIIVIVGYNEAQLHALSEELLHIWDDSQYFFNKIRNRITDEHELHTQSQVMNEFIRISLKNITKFHIANINLIRELDYDMRPILAFEYSIKVISIIAGLLGGLENTFLQLPYMIVQIFMDCLSGQRLIDACDHFEKSVYSCQWEKFNSSNQRTVRLMLMMSQKTLMLSAGGVAKLNFNFLMNILKSTYSIYTTLKSTVN